MAPWGLTQGGALPSHLWGSLLWELRARPWEWPGRLENACVSPVSTERLAILVGQGQ